LTSLCRFCNEWLIGTKYDGTALCLLADLVT
jgi:hypothetical protein